MQQLFQELQTHAPLSDLKAEVEADLEAISNLLHEVALEEVRTSSILENAPSRAPWEAERGVRVRAAHADDCDEQGVPVDKGGAQSDEDRIAFDIPQYGAKQ